MPSKDKRIFFPAGQKRIYIQFYDIPNGPEQRKFQRMGIELGSYMGSKTYLVNVSEEQFTALQAMGSVRGVEEVFIEDKISIALYNEQVPPYVKNEDGTVTFQARLHERVDINIALNELEKAGVIIDKEQSYGFKIIFKSKPEQIHAITSRNFVESLDYVSPPNEIHNANAGKVARVRGSVDNNDVEQAGYDLTGNGVHVAVWDGLAIQTHADLKNRVTIKTNLTGPISKPKHGHATHVAGTIGGSGANNVNAKGMAPFVELYSYDFDTFEPEKLGDAYKDKDAQIILSNHSWGARVGWQGTTGFDIGREDLFGDYSDESKRWDEMARKYDLIIVKSAGNDRNEGIYSMLKSEIDAAKQDFIWVYSHSPFNAAGGTVRIGGEEITYETLGCRDWPEWAENPIRLPTLEVLKRGANNTQAAFHQSGDYVLPLPIRFDGDLHALLDANIGQDYFKAEFYTNIGPRASAKNVITVGAIRDDGTTMTELSSWGPTKDGRIKPDIVANGDGLLSTMPTEPNDNEIIWDWYKVGNHWHSYKSGTSMAAPVVTGICALIKEFWEKPDNNGLLPTTEPTPDIIKALLCQTADDIGPPGPDYQNGFGSVNAKRAIDLIKDSLTEGNNKVVQDVISNGQQKMYSVNIPQDTPEIKATLCWIDEKGSIIAENAIVNDLDLELIDPSGTVHYPFKLNKDYPTVPATNIKKNSVDTVEQLLVSVPTEGEWMLKVKGTELPNAFQRFALICNLPIVSEKYYTNDPQQNVSSFFSGVSFGSNPETVKKSSPLPLDTCIITPEQMDIIERIISVSLVLDVEDLDTANEGLLVDADGNPVSHLAKTNVWYWGGVRTTITIDLPPSLFIHSNNPLPLQLCNTEFEFQGVGFGYKVYSANLVVKYIKKGSEDIFAEGQINGGWKYYTLPNRPNGWSYAIDEGQKYNKGLSFSHKFKLKDMLTLDALGSVKAARLTVIAKDIDHDEVKLYLNGTEILTLPATGTEGIVRSMSVFFPENKLSFLSGFDQEHSLELKASDAEDEFTLYYVDFTVDHLVPYEKLFAPTNLEARAGDRSISLSWNLVTEDGLAGYHVYRADSAQGPFDPITTALLQNAYFTDSGLINQKAYYYRVVAVGDGKQESDPSTVTATPEVDPKSRTIFSLIKVRFFLSFNRIIHAAIWATSSPQYTSAGVFLEND